MFLDIGDYGGTNDASVHSNSAFGQTFNYCPTKVKLPSRAPCGNNILPYVLLDDILHLKPCVIKSYSGKNLDCLKSGFLKPDAP